MNRIRIGIDVGALTVKAARLDAASPEPRYAYRLHHGEPGGTLRELLGELAPEGACTVAVTGGLSGALPHHDALARVDAVQATIAAVGWLLPGMRNIIDIGGAGLRFIRLDENGRFAHFSANSQCAAGTGSFLDEQAARLGLAHHDLAGLDAVAEPPPVATRCAVFAKSDLIHLQQAGANVAEMWSGLCRGMAQTALQTLLRGKPLEGSTALVGGVAQNREVLRWLAALASSPVVTCREAHVAAALGAALLSPIDGASAVEWRAWLANGKPAAPRPVRPGARLDRAIPILSAGAAARRSPERVSRLPGGGVLHEPLALRRTRYPSFAVDDSYVDTAGNEVRVSRWPAGERVAGYLGIDIGSTSTKLCLVDSHGDVLVDIYRKTAGNPIGATQKLFDALLHLQAARGACVEILGCGTTGSGRKLVGAVVGADAVVNEISAHVAGAMHVDPELETIFEIGGQDSKYMRTASGAIVDSNMNYVCAAGTGSFVEEQARKLGVPLPEVGDRVLGLVPPPTSDRCTVFMEQDVNDLLRAGHGVDEALAAVMRSVVQNYLNKVVGNRPWSRRKVGFQGATARNKGLVAAFETLLGVEMVVSPYCHVMGAWGVALLTQAQLERSLRPTTFGGLELSTRRIDLRKERCDLCNNECELTFAHVEGNDHEPSWGYLCGRDPSESRVRVHAEYDLFRRRRSWLLQEGAVVERTGTGDAGAGASGSRGAASLATAQEVVGAASGGPVLRNVRAVRPVRVVMPRALTFFSHLPLWRRLLGELGAQMEIAPESSRATRERGAALVGAEFCFPVKLAHGQVGETLAESDADYVLVPRMVAQPPAAEQSGSYFCPYVQGFPSVIEAAVGHVGDGPERLLTPTVDQRQPEEQQVDDLHRALGVPLGVTRAQVRAAYRAALESQAKFEARCREAGQAALAKLAQEGKQAIVLVGRPYNLMDPGANLDLPRKIAEMGWPVIPLDCLPFEPERLPPRYRNLYWAYGQRLLSALQFVRRHDNLFAIYFTNFNCGPDSFLLSYAEEIMGGKPMLSLELDEHGADAGYITRVEAYLDVVRGWKPASVRVTHGAAAPAAANGNLRQRRIWIPPMHPVSSSLFAAAFRGAGYDAVPMPTETRADLEVGQRVTRGCECLPMRTTTGAFLNAIASPAERGRQHALFMPTATGPCRFGQYATLDRLILERDGHEEIPILSPSGDNAYCGLESELRRTLWKALLAADALENLACTVRPYEETAGDADAAFATWQAAAERALEARQDLLPVVRRAGAAFARIPRRVGRKLLVGIVGEIYVRSNPFCNEDLVRSIERAGGEAWSAPIPEWILFTTWQDAWRPGPPPRTPKQLADRLARRVRLRLMHNMKSAYWKAAGPLLAARHEPGIADTVRAGQAYVPFSVGGETLLSLGRAVYFARQGVALVVNASPFGCMPGTMAAALFARYEKETGIPVVNLFYEGAGGVNRQLDVFVANLGDRNAPPLRPIAPRSTILPASAGAESSAVGAGSRSSTNPL